MATEVQEMCDGHGENVRWRRRFGWKWKKEVKRDVRILDPRRGVGDVKIYVYPEILVTDSYSGRWEVNGVEMVALNSSHVWMDGVHIM